MAAYIRLCTMASLIIGLRYFSVSFMLPVR